MRKGGRAPYITHLMAVAALVGEHGGAEPQVIAALLHDAGEDQGGQATIATIRHRFGAEVADYVTACSDTLESPKPEWRQRKKRFLASLAGASPGVKLIVAADKLHNARSLASELRHQGNALWNRFNGGREGSLWVLAESMRALAQDWSHPILHDLAEAVDRVHRLSAEFSE